MRKLLLIATAALVVTWARRLHWGEAWYRLRRGPQSLVVTDCLFEPPPDGQPLIRTSRDGTTLRGLRIGRA